jgi:hypothetical protein
MNTSKNSGSRNRRLLLTSMAAIGLMLGGVGIASAATSPTPVQPPVVATVVTPSVPAPAVNEAPDTNEAKDANEASEANEAPDANDEVDGVDCEDGIDAKTGAECDGGPAANQTDGSAE